MLHTDPFINYFQEMFMSHESLEQEIESLVPAQTTLLPGSRRGFLQATAFAGFAASVVPSGDLAAQTITTDLVGLEAGMTQLSTGSGSIPAYFARPAGKKGLATIVVAQEIFGVHEHIKDVCRRFAKQGYLAIAPEFFFRQGDPTKLTTMAELFEKIVSKVPDAQVLGDIEAALKWSESNGGVKGLAGLTGFCWGGRIVWLASAAMPGLKGGVAWYGRIRTTVTDTNPFHPIDIAEKLRWPVLGLYGGKDGGIPNSDVDEMRTKLSFGGPASMASEIITYAEAPHAFHADYRPSYRKAEAEDGWKRCLAWFAKTLKA